MMKIKTKSQNKTLKLTVHFLKVAYVAKAHGLKGELFLATFNPQADWPFNLKTLKIGEQIFDIEKYSPHKKGFIVKLKGCDEKSEADKLKSQLVYIDKALFKSEHKSDFYLAEILGFSVYIEYQQEDGQKDTLQKDTCKQDKSQNEKGVLLYFESDQKAQDFLVICFTNSQKQTQNYSIPLAYIKQIDFDNQTFTLELPPNYLEIFKSK